MEEKTGRSRRPQNCHLWKEKKNKKHPNNPTEQSQTRQVDKTKGCARNLK